MHFFKELLYTEPYVRYVLVLQTKYNFELLFSNMKMQFCQVENLVKFQAKSISFVIVLLVENSFNYRISTNSFRP